MHRFSLERHRRLAHNLATCRKRAVFPADGSVAPDLYTQHAHVIDDVLSYTRRRHRLSADAGDEFASWALLKLIDNDYAVLRKFEGRSKVRTFLIAVVQNLFLDWRNAEWGKWRPTTDAKNAGPIGVELERLIIRDRMSFGEAAELLVSRGTAESRAACEAIWALLPQRAPRDVINDSELVNMPAKNRADDDLNNHEREVQARAASVAMAHAMSSQPPQDQLIFRLRFHDGFTVARIAKLFDEDQKGLYRRFDRICGVLKASMLASGVSPADAAELLANPMGDLDSVFEEPMGDLETGPSTSTSTGGEHV